MAIHAQFSEDYRTLIFVSSEKFLSHSGNYRLKTIDWSSKKEQIIIDTYEEYPKVMYLHKGK